MNIDKAIDALVGREDRYSGDKDDKGNWYKGKLEGTMWGVTAAVARAYGYHDAMADMPRNTAVSIYKSRYLLAPHFDTVGTIDEKIAERLFDIGVNAGPTTGVKFLQRALNTLNRQGHDFPDMAVDGVVGNITLSAMRTFIALRGREGRDTLLFMIAAQQSVFYMETAEHRPANESFEMGWQSQRAMMGVAV